MEVLAAMVDIIVQDIQRAINNLEPINEVVNACVVCMYDNSARGILLDSILMLSGATGTGALIKEFYKNPLDWKQGSFTWYGAEWARASMASSRRV